MGEIDPRQMSKTGGESWGYSLRQNGRLEGSRRLYQRQLCSRRAHGCP